MKKFALATALCAFSFAVSAQTTPSDSNVTIVGKSLSAARAAKLVLWLGPCASTANSAAVATIRHPVHGETERERE